MIPSAGPNTRAADPDLDAGWSGAQSPGVPLVATMGYAWGRKRRHCTLHPFEKEDVFLDNLVN